LETSKKRIDYALHQALKKRSDLARKMDVERSTISDMLNSPGDAPMKYITAVADLTGFRAEWLLTGKEPKKEGEGVEEEQAPYGNLKTEQKLEMLVASQQRTIQLLEEKIKRLEQEIEAGKNKVNK
jgi:hypothetical protein